MYEREDETRGRMKYIYIYTIARVNKSSDEFSFSKRVAFILIVATNIAQTSLGRTYAKMYFVLYMMLSFERSFRRYYCDTHRRSEAVA